MKLFPSIADLTPERFELQVKAWLESVSGPLEEFTAEHQEAIAGHDGEYTIDVTARFAALGGARFLVLVECKKHQNPIKRDVVQVLRDKQSSLGAQKAIVVSTSPFQTGAITYASEHGIALVQIVSGQARYIQANAGWSMRPIPEDAEDFVGLFYGQNPEGKLIFPMLITARSNIELARYLGPTD